MGLRVTTLVPVRMVGVVEAVAQEVGLEARSTKSSTVAERQVRLVAELME
jgi:hypothetical protein